MAIRIVRLGTPRHTGEGVRLGTVRRPPRGIPKTRFAKDNWYDVWLPTLAPTLDLMKQALAAKTEPRWRAFERKFRAQLQQPDAAHLLDALAALSHASDFSVGCYCEDERHCHRSILRDELQKRGAALVPAPAVPRV
jgi:uncharacterized protein YeaO (DUF488 family)